MKVLHAARSDVGLARQNNEDAYLVDESLGLYIIADGMGGTAGGEIASRTVCEVVHRAIRNESGRLQAFAAGKSTAAPSAVNQILVNAIRQAGSRVHEMAREDPSLAGMGSTAVVMLVVGEQMFIAHVGDSRLYLIRDRQLHQLTRDHSLVEELKQLGKIENADQVKAKFRNAITRAVGVYESVQPDTMDLVPLPGDRFLMCTDGLHSTATEEELVWLLRHLSPDDCTHNLVRHANSKGGKDNITALVLDVREVETARARLTQQKLDTLRSVALFRYFTFDELLKVTSLFEEQRFEQGEMVCREGEIGEQLFVLLDGEAWITKKGVKVAEVHPGDHFGELSLIDRHPRSADVEAILPALCMVMSRKKFYTLVREGTQMSVKLLWSLAQVASARLRQTTDELGLAKTMAMTLNERDAMRPLYQEITVDSETDLSEES